MAVLAATLVLAAVLAGCGGAGDDAAHDRQGDDATDWRCRRGGWRICGQAPRRFQQDLAVALRGRPVRDGVCEDSHDRTRRWEWLA
jgi:hypothetical protein